MEGNDFVTVVSVGEQQVEKLTKVVTDVPNDTSFVTVVSIGEKDSTEIDILAPNGSSDQEHCLNGHGSDNCEYEDVEVVNVYRLPGERLGFGLKFEGGTKSSECVQRLFIQSCALDSPASRVSASWGPLGEGDEIIAIDKQPVINLTRIDCVRCLKDSPVVIQLTVKKRSNDVKKDTDGDAPLVVSAEQKRKPPPPPPIPPRKIPRRIPTANKSNMVIPPTGFADESPKPSARNRMSANETEEEKKATKRLPSPRCSQRPITPKKTLDRRSSDGSLNPLDRRSSDGSLNPPDAESYTNLLSQEGETVRTESESDDTGSSISTVVDRFSTTSNSSFSESRSVESSIPSTPILTPKHIDLAKVLIPFEHLEREFASRLETNETGVTIALITETDKAADSSKVEEAVTLKPPVNFQDAPLSYADENVISSSNNVLVEENKENEKSNTHMNGLNARNNNANVDTTGDDNENVVITNNKQQNYENISLQEQPGIQINSKTPPTPLPRSLTPEHASRIPKRKAPPPPPPRAVKKVTKHSKIEDSDSKFNTIENWLQDAITEGMDKADAANEPGSKCKGDSEPLINKDDAYKMTVVIKGEHLPRLIDFVPKISPINTPVLDIADPFPDKVQNDKSKDETVVQTNTHETFSEKLNAEDISEMMEIDLNTNSMSNPIEMSEKIFAEAFFLSKNTYEQEKKLNKFNEYNGFLDDIKLESDGSSGSGSSDDEIMADITDGPCEAYFQYWGPTLLPTIGEDEEEYSSLENQAKGPIVIIDRGETSDISAQTQQLPREDTKKIDVVTLQAAAVKEEEKQSTSQLSSKNIFTENDSVSVSRVVVDKINENKINSECNEEKTSVRDGDLVDNHSRSHFIECYAVHCERKVNIINSGHVGEVLQGVPLDVNPTIDLSKREASCRSLDMVENHESYSESSVDKIDLDEHSIVPVRRETLDNRKSEMDHLISDLQLQKQTDTDSLYDNADCQNVLKAVFCVKEVNSVEPICREVQNGELCSEMKTEPDGASDDTGTVDTSVRRVELAPPTTLEPPGDDPAPATLAPTSASDSAQLIGVDGIMEPLLPLQPPPLPPSMTSAHHLGSPPPSFSRLPPDGHEFPPNYTEPMPATTETYNGKTDPSFQSKMFIQAECMKTSPPPLPKSVPPFVLPRMKSYNDVPVFENGVELGRRLSGSSLSPVKEAKPSWVKDDVEDVKPIRKYSTSSIDERLRTIRIEDISRSRRKDDKSERSVRDKIAMFSTRPTDAEQETPLFPNNISLPTTPPRKLSKTFKSSEDVFNNIDEPDGTIQTKRFSKSSLSIDKVGLRADVNKSPSPSYVKVHETSVINIQPKVNRIHNEDDTVFVAPARRYSSTLEITKKPLNYKETSKDSNSCSVDSSTLPRKVNIERSSPNSAILTRATSFSGSTYMNMHSRSQSLSDVAINDEARKRSLNDLIEQRRKSMSKLRGLVIPERVTELQPIIDLPEIRSKDSILNKPPKITRNSHHSVSAQPIKATAQMSQMPWKTQNISSNLPKYSPAFKRKSLQVYEETVIPLSDLNSSEGKFMANDYKERKTPVKPPRTSLVNLRPKSLHVDKDPPKYLDNLLLPLSDSSYEFIDSKDKSTSVKARMENSRFETDSDNDSAVSSSQSSYISRGYSPPVSPIQNTVRTHLILSASPSDSSDERPNHEPPIEKQPLMRTLSSETNISVASSTTSTLTSGSQASCSSVGSSNYDSRRVLKPSSVEAINRKNILQSAKCRSGRDLKGSPLIQRKFDEDSTDGNEDLPPAYPKYKSRTMSKLANNNNNNNNEVQEVVHYKVHAEETIVDSVINVAYIDVEDNRHSIMFSNELNSLEYTLTPPPSGDEMKKSPMQEIEASDSDTDIRKWVRSEAKFAQQKVTDLQNDKYSKENGYDIEHSRKKSYDSVVLSSEYKNGITVRRSGVPEMGKANNRIDPSPGTPKIIDRDIVSSRFEYMNKDKRSTSVNDIRKTFEKTQPPTALTLNMRNGNGKVNGSMNNINHGRMSSLDSTTSEGSSGVSSMITTSQNNTTGSSNNLQSGDFGSISSLTSSTSVISQQELQQLIDEANACNEEWGLSGSPVSLSDALVVVLHRDNPSASIGITLAGGADYEAKEITVHKVLVGSPADKDGRVQKGDRVLSINGRSMKGLSHKESLAVLKSPRSEVVLVTSRNNVTSQPATPTTRQHRRSNHQQSQSLDNTLDTAGATLIPIVKSEGGSLVAVTLNKDGAGLGFSLEGGQDSPLGDKPLIIKKIFTGGAAEKSNLLVAGDELVMVNHTLVSALSRIEVWAIMKKLPDGNVTITIRR